MAHIGLPRVSGLREASNLSCFQVEHLPWLRPPEANARATRAVMLMVALSLCKISARVQHFSHFSSKTNPMMCCTRATVKSKGMITTRLEMELRAANSNLASAAQTAQKMRGACLALRCELVKVTQKLPPGCGGQNQWDPILG